MKSLSARIAPFFVCGLALGLSACLTPRVHDKIPADVALSPGEVFYVENDGRCAQGEVIKITGGSRERGIERKYECVMRPQ